MKKNNIPKIILPLLTTVIGAKFIVFLSEKTENIIIKIIIALCGSFLIITIPRILIYNLEE